MKGVVLMWLFPFALLGSTACGMFLSGDRCSEEPIAFEDGVYTTEEWGVLDRGGVGLHATGGPKTVTVDTQNEQVTIEYVDAEGATRLEKWAMTVYPQQTSD